MKVDASFPFLAAKEDGDECEYSSRPWWALVTQNQSHRKVYTLTASPCRACTPTFAKRRKAIQDQTAPRRTKRLAKHTFESDHAMVSSSLTYYLSSTHFCPYFLPPLFKIPDTLRHLRPSAATVTTMNDQTAEECLQRFFLLLSISSDGLETGNSAAGLSDPENETRGG